MFKKNIIEKKIQFNETYFVFAIRKNESSKVNLLPHRAHEFCAVSKNSYGEILCHGQSSAIRRRPK